MALDPADFSFFQKFLHEKSGLSINEDKIYLLESRLMPVAKKWELSSLHEIAKSLQSGPERKLTQDVVDAMTTNETLFFRDDRPFKFFRGTLLPDLLKAREHKKHIRIWSAACSTGQEPYSIAMTLAEILPTADEWRIEILGTDISDSILKQACSGTFNQFEIQRGLPIHMVMKYFQQDGSQWKIHDKIRKMVRFESFNLLDRMDRFGTFDVIFCRNVLIYFDDETKRKVLKNLSDRLAPDGTLMLGGSETVIGICPELKINAACPGLYELQTTSAQVASSSPRVAVFPKKPAMIEPLIKATEKAFEK